MSIVNTLSLESNRQIKINFDGKISKVNSTSALEFKISS